jgi:hypothetical protein
VWDRRSVEKRNELSFDPNLFVPSFGRMVLESDQIATANESTERQSLNTF